MKRAYPQYLAAGGEKLPPEMLKVLFPLDYWPLIRAMRPSTSSIPYLVAALIAQESTFTADVRSSANAYGLMQLLPSTGRQYARKLRHADASRRHADRPPKPTSRWARPYFADLRAAVRRRCTTRWPPTTPAPNRVARWIAERAGTRPQDEFIDDIPFPETQNYVKRILGTAEDYRRLYGK